jgi:hypothetical protein
MESYYRIMKLWKKCKRLGITFLNLPFAEIATIIQLRSMRKEKNEKFNILHYAWLRIVDIYKYGNPLKK